MARTILYAGCYTHDTDVAIRVYAADDPHGAIEPVQDVADGAHHSFLAAHPDGATLYAVSESATFDGAPGGGIVAYRIDAIDGSLTMVDRVPSHGTAPCFVDVTPDGRHLLVANYVSGAVAAYALEPNGRIGELLGRRQHLGSGPHDRQESAHAHCFRSSRDGRSAYAVDLGIDRVVRYTLGDGLPVADELVLTPGSGPRHLAIHPRLPVAVIVCELDNTLVTADIDPTSGRLARSGVAATVPADADGASIAAEVRVDPSGRHVYVSNRGHDSIAVFELDAERRPQLVGHVSSGGATPRGFAVHPSGRALLAAHQDSNTIVSFDLDPTTGMPAPRDERWSIIAPVCLTFVQLDR